MSDTTTSDAAPDEADRPRAAPAVCIGVPVYNGAATLPAALDSLLAQTFADFEIVISDNASTDGTAAICESYAAADPRIRHVRQPRNLGAAGNFGFLRDQARSRYFMWAAADDIRSPDFLEANIRFLDANPGYVASTSPNRSVGRRVADFAVEGPPEERFAIFLDNCWHSHGIFYSVMRTEVIRGCPIEHFLAFDWAVGLHLARHGPIHRTREGLLSSSPSGESRRPGIWRAFRTHPVGWVVPFHRVSAYAMRLSSGFGTPARVGLALRLCRLNLAAAWSQARAELSLAFRNDARGSRKGV